MASSGVLSKSFEDGKYILDIEWSVSKRDGANYTSSIKRKAYFTNNTPYDVTIKKGDISCRAFGGYSMEVLNSSMSRTFPANSRTAIARNGLWDTTEYTDTVYHNIDGTSSPSIEYVIYYSEYGKTFSINDSITLEPYDKRITASLSTDNINVGETLEITTDNKLNCAYELIASVNGLTEKFAEGEKGQTIKWLVPNSFRSVISPVTKTGVCTIECKTYGIDKIPHLEEDEDGSLITVYTKEYVYIGSKTYMLTLRVSETDEPEVEITVEAVSRITNRDMRGIYIAGYTYLEITNKCTAKNGATIQSVVTTVYGQSYTGNKVTTESIPRTANGSIPISVKATDSNGLSSTFIKYIEITAYKPPKIEKFAIHRCGSDGTLDDEGDCCFVEYTFSADPLIEYKASRNALQSAIIQVQRVKTDDTAEDYPVDTYSIDCSSLLSYSGSMIIENIDIEACFDISLIVEDNVTKVPNSETLSTAVTIVDITEDGTGFCFGGVAEYKNLVDFKLPVRMSKNFQCSEEWIEENVIGSINAYFGYGEYNDILGLQVDYENKIYTRLAGAAGLTAGTDFDKFSMYGGRKRCNVGNNGVIKAFYGDATYSDTGTNGQVMVYQPKFYYRVVPIKIDKNENGLGYHIRKANYYVSSSPVQGFKLHPAFYDENGNEIDYILYSAYEGSLWSTSIGGYFKDGTMTETALDPAKDYICSESTVKPISGLYKSLTKTNFEKTANHRGKGWHCETIKTLSANQLLMMIELGTMNFQSAIGQGVVSITSVGNYNCSSLTGATRSLGNATGNAPWTTNEIGGTQTTYYPSDTGKISVTYRGIENPWGNIYKHINGINIWGDGTMKGGQPYIADDFNFSETKHDDNYKPVGFTLPNENGYIKAMGYGSKEYDWLIMPSEVGGTSALPVGDYVNATADVSAHKVVMYGGMWNSASAAGGFTYYCSDGAGTKYKSFGGRIVYIPTAE